MNHSAVTTFPVTDGVAQAAEGEDVEFDQFLLTAPVLFDEQTGAADAGVIHQ